MYRGEEEKTVLKSEPWSITHMAFWYFTQLSMSLPFCTTKLHWIEIQPSPYSAWLNNWKNLSLRIRHTCIKKWSLIFNMVIELSILIPLCLVLVSYINALIIAFRWEVCSSPLSWTLPCDLLFPMSFRGCNLSRGLKCACMTGLACVYCCHWHKKKYFG